MLIDIQLFSEWLKVNTKYSDNVITDTISRMKRADSILTWNSETTYLFFLEQAEDFKKLSVSVRSQIRKAVKLYSDFYADTGLQPICPKCGKAYYGYPATSRVDNKTEICPLCGTREALDAAGIPAEQQEEIIAAMSASIPTPENTVKIDVKEALERLKDPQVQEEIKAILNGGDE